MFVGQSIQTYSYAGWVKSRELMYSMVTIVIFNYINIVININGTKYWSFTERADSGALITHTQ